MTVPFFYFPGYDGAQRQITLDAETSRHVVQVLRMGKDAELNLTDGKGNLLSCVITDDHKKHCVVEVKQQHRKDRNLRKVYIAISLIKNVNRFEWFLEKATEIGIDGIIPVICERTEKERFRHDRMQGICISAMLQSQQVWLPELREPVAFSRWITGQDSGTEKYIAHCMRGEKKNLALQQLNHPDVVICIGPEGDFSPREAGQAIENNFIPVSLGETRLRTETAGVVAATLLRLAIG